jgi:hypothetical protein
MKLISTSKPLPNFFGLLHEMLILSAYQVIATEFAMDRGEMPLIFECSERQVQTTPPRDTWNRNSSSAPSMETDSMSIGVCASLSMISVYFDA